MSEPRSSANQGQVLDDVRRALGRSKTLRPAPLDPFVEASADVDSEELVTRFTSELTAVGGHVYRVVSDKLQFVDGLAQTSVCASGDGSQTEVYATETKLKFVEQLATRIAEICRSSGATEVALSQSSLIAQMELADQLTGRGLSVFASKAAGPSEHDQLVARLAASGAGVTAVDYAIAETGTIVLSDEGNALLVSLLPPVHIALLRSRQISASLSDVIGKLSSERINRGNDQSQPCHSATLITGPSRTGDVELTLSIGVHGPKELHVIIID